MTFEEALKRLNEISVEIDNPNVPLDKSVSLYSEAVQLVKLCKDYIESAKLVIENAEEAKGQD